MRKVSLVLIVMLKKYIPSTDVPKSKDPTLVTVGKESFT